MPLVGWHATAWSGGIPRAVFCMPRVACQQTNAGAAVRPLGRAGRRWRQGRPAGQGRAPQRQGRAGQGRAGRVWPASGRAGRGGRPAGQGKPERWPASPQRHHSDTTATPGRKRHYRRGGACTLWNFAYIECAAPSPRMKGLRHDHNFSPDSLAQFWRRICGA